MKFIKKFESFPTDDNRGDEQTYPKYNQANNLRAKEYIDSVFNSGSGPEVTKICKEIGCERPSDDNSLDKVREKAIEYFKQNPERIPDIGNSGFKTYPFNGGDAVVRTNNVGGTQNESSRPGPTDSGSTKVAVSKEEMRLFGKEASLIGLLKKNKIVLNNGIVWFKKDDERTRKILDIFLEMDEIENNEEIDNEKIDESLEHTDFDETITALKNLYNKIVVESKNDKRMNDMKYMINDISSDVQRAKRLYGALVRKVKDEEIEPDPKPVDDESNDVSLYPQGDRNWRPTFHFSKDPNSKLNKK